MHNYKEQKSEQSVAKLCKNYFREGLDSRGQKTQKVKCGCLQFKMCIKSYNLSTQSTQGHYNYRPSKKHRKQKISSVNDLTCSWMGTAKLLALNCELE